MVQLSRAPIGIGIPIPDRRSPADAGGGSEGAEPPPADFDPADNPSNPDLVSGADASEPPD